MKKNKDKNIIPGYKGIMELDLTNIPDSNKKTIIDQHFQDIKNYKIEQENLSPRLRYENTIEIAKKKLFLENKIIKERLLKQKKN